MAQSVNKSTLIGNLGRDPEIRTTPSGEMVANFSVACTESWKDKSGQKQEHTEWVNCVAWRGLADLVQKYLKKGDKVYIEGKLQTRSWEDKNGGGKRYATEVIVKELVFIGGKSEGGHGGGHAASNGGTTGFDDFGPTGGVSPASAEDEVLLPF